MVVQDMIWALHGRGKFPGHDVLCGLQKSGVERADGYRSVPMGADGCMCKKGSKNKTKRAPNGRAGDVLWRMHTVQKPRKSTTMVMTIIEGYCEVFRDNNGCAVWNGCVYARMGKQTEQRRQKKRKRESANVLNPLIYKAKTTSTKRVKTTSRKARTRQNKKQATN